MDQRDDRIITTATRIRNLSISRFENIVGGGKNSPRSLSASLHCKRASDQPITQRSQICDGITSTKAKIAPSKAATTYAAAAAAIKI